MFKFTRKKTKSQVVSNDIPNRNRNEEKKLDKILNRKNVSRVSTQSLDDISRELTPNLRDTYDQTLMGIKKRKRDNDQKRTDSDRSVLEMDRVSEKSIKTIKGIDKYIERTSNNDSNDSGQSNGSLSSISTTISESTISLINVTYSGFKSLISNVEKYTSTHGSFNKRFSEALENTTEIVAEMDKRSKIGSKLDNKKQYQLEDMLTGNVTVGKLMLQ